MKQFTILIISGLLLLVIQPNTVQSTGCLTNTRADGLISAIEQPATNKFGNTIGKCVIDDKASFVSYKLPGYDDLKSIYYTQAKSSSGITKHNPLTGDKNESDIQLTIGKDHIYYITDNLTINGNISGGGAQIGVIFVDKNLSITQNISSTAGLVFVVGGDINISQNIDTINAVLISQGKIYTAGAGCGNSSVDKKSDNTPISALTINGSLISLNSGKPIIFCRKLTDNSLLPAEKIVYQPKYLVILKDLFADTYQKWSEIQ